MTRAALPALALLIGALSSCAAEPAPSDASEEDFCEVQGTLFKDLQLGGDGPTPNGDDVVESLRSWADEVEQVGTPEGMPPEARAGFERVVELAREADPEDFDEDKDPSMPEMSPEAQEQAQAFTLYVATTCGAGGEQSSLPEVPALPG